MSTQSEQILENQLVEQLNGLGYERLSIPNEAALLANLKTQLEKHNNTEFSENEFKKVINIQVKVLYLRKQKHLEKNSTS